MGKRDEVFWKNRSGKKFQAEILEGFLVVVESQGPEGIGGEWSIRPGFSVDNQ